MGKMRKIRMICLNLGAVVFLAGCQTTGQSTFCDAASPINLSEADIGSLSNSGARQIAAHNRTGKRLCKWRRR